MCTGTESRIREDRNIALLRPDVASVPPPLAIPGDDSGWLVPPASFIENDWLNEDWGQPISGEDDLEQQVHVPPPVPVDNLERHVAPPPVPVDDGRRQVAPPPVPADDGGWSAPAPPPVPMDDSRRQVAPPPVPADDGGWSVPAPPIPVWSGAVPPCPCPGYPVTPVTEVQGMGMGAAGGPIPTGCRQSGGHKKTQREVAVEAVLMGGGEDVATVTTPAPTRLKPLVTRIGLTKADKDALRNLIPKRARASVAKKNWTPDPLLVTALTTASECPENHRFAQQLRAASAQQSAFSNFYGHGGILSHAASYTFTHGDWVPAHDPTTPSVQGGHGVRRGCDWEGRPNGN